LATENLTRRKRLTTVAESGGDAAFLASDRASGMTGTVASLTGGEVVDAEPYVLCRKKRSSTDEFRPPRRFYR
jgi:hypothetical protein